MNCPKCGADNANDRTICINCGATLSEYSEPSINSNGNETNTVSTLEKNTISSDVYIDNNNKNVKKKKKFHIITFLVIVIIIAIFAFIGIFVYNKFIKKEITYGTKSTNEEITYNYSEDGTTKFIDGAFSNKRVTSETEVKEALKDFKDTLGIKDVDKELTLEYEENSEDVTYYRFNQIYNGVQVLEKNIVISVDKKGNITGYSGYFEPNINIDTVPKLKEDEIDEIAKRKLGEEAKIIDKKLYIKADNENKLIYVVNGYSNTDALELEIDANTGEILDSVSLFEGASNYEYTGEGLNGKTYTINLEEFFDVNEFKTKYRFYDAKRKIVISDYSLIGDVMATAISAIPGANPYAVEIENGVIKKPWYNESIVNEAVTAMADFEKIYDYYKNVLGRDSYDNKGSKIIVNIGVTDKTFTNKDLNNAFWFKLTHQMFIGSYNGKSLTTSLDVLAHEFTHGVVESIVKFASSQTKEKKNEAFETGALSEAYPDIIGSLIEGKNWTIAEDIEVIRDGANPEEFGNPSKKGGKYYYPDGYLTSGATLEEFLAKNNLENVQDYDGGGIHQNSNVVLHAAYLMHQSGAFKNREQMAKVWYNSLFYLSSRASFEDCALAVIKSAKNLGLGSSSIQKITQAFQETNMLESKDYKLSGNVTYEKLPVNAAEIKIYSGLDNSLVTTLKTDKAGKYELNLKTGNYIINVSKENLEPFEANLVIKGNSTYNVNLGKKGNKEENKNGKDDKGDEKLSTVSKSPNDVNLTIYFLSANDNDGVIIDHETFALEKGKTLSSGIIVNTVNDFFETEFITTDSESFYVNFGEFQAEFAWYYKGTNTKFKWDQPINEDVEIEMKLLNGLIDNDLIKNIYDIFY